MKRLFRFLCPLILAVLVPAVAEAAGCSREPARALEAFVGTWQEYTVLEDGERLEGTLVFEYALDGCAIRQTFAAVGSDFRFETLGFLDAETGRWRETYVFNDGRSRSWEWIPLGVDWLQAPLDSELRLEKRLRVTEIETDAYLVVEESSSDGGVTWIPGEKTRTRRALQ